MSAVDWSQFTPAENNVSVGPPADGHKYSAEQMATLDAKSGALLGQEERDAPGTVPPAALRGKSPTTIEAFNDSKGTDWSQFTPANDAAVDWSKFSPVPDEPVQEQYAGPDMPPIQPVGDKPALVGSVMQGVTGGGNSNYDLRGTGFQTPEQAADARAKSGKLSDGKFDAPPASLTHTDYDFAKVKQLRDAGVAARTLNAAYQSAAKTSGGIVRFTADLSGDEDFAKQMKAYTDSVQASIAQNTAATSKNPMEQQLQGLAAASPAIAVGLLGAPLTAFAMQTFGDQYTDGRDAGLDLGESAIRAGSLAAVQTLAFKYGIGKQLSELPNIKALAGNMDGLAKAFVDNMTPMQLSTLGTNIIDQLPGIGLHQGMTPEEMVKAQLETVQAVIFQTAAIHGAHSAVGWTAAKIAPAKAEAPKAPVATPHDTTVATDLLGGKTVEQTKPATPEHEAILNEARAANEIPRAEEGAPTPEDDALLAQAEAAVKAQEEAQTGADTSVAAESPVAPSNDVVEAPEKVAETPAIEPAPAPAAEAPAAELPAPEFTEPRAEPKRAEAPKEQAPAHVETPEETALRAGVSGALYPSAPDSMKPGDIKLSKKTKQEAELSAAVQEAFGTKVEFVDVAPEHAKFGALVLDHDATARTLYIRRGTGEPVNFLVGHELTHILRTEHPEVYSQLLKEMLPHLPEAAAKEGLKHHSMWDIAAKDDRQSIIKRMIADRGGEHEIGTLAHEEMIADFMGKRWMDPTFWKSLSKEQPDLFQRVGQVMSKMLAKLLKTVTGGKNVAKADWFKDVQETREAIDRALVEWAHRERSARDEQDIEQLDPAALKKEANSLLAKKVIDRGEHAEIMAHIKDGELDHASNLIDGFGDMRSASLRRTVTAEVIPSSHVDEGKDIASADRETKDRYQDHILKHVDVDGLISDLGLSKDDITVERGVGGYGGSTSPNLLLHAADHVPLEKVRELAHSLMYVFKQDAVPFFKPKHELLDAHANPVEGADLGVEIKFDHSLTAEHDQAIIEELHNALGDDAGFTKVGDDSISVINFGGGNDAVKNQVFIQSLKRFAGAIADRAVVRGFDKFGAESEYPYHDWQADTKGSSLRDSVGQGREEQSSLHQGLDHRRQLFEEAARSFTDAGKSDGDITSHDVQREVGQRLDGIVADLSREHHDTPEFKEWFRDSMLVNKDGSPKVMYHGTGRDLTEFRPKQAKAIYITGDPNFAEGFAGASLNWMTKNGTAAEQRWAAESVYPLYVRAERIFGADPEGDTAKIIERLESSVVTKSFPDKVLPGVTHDREGVWLSDPRGNKLFYSRNELAEGLHSRSWDIVESVEVQNFIHELGYDSFMTYEAGRTNLAIYDPNAVKSATGNSGQYSSSDNRIAFSRESPEFKEWFSDSKVVDEKGEPLKVYHGSSADRTDGEGIDEFKPNTFFSDKARTASEFAQGRDGGAPFVQPVYIRMTNPMRLTRSIMDTMEDVEQRDFERARKQGHDGIIYNYDDIKERAFVTFTPDQVKSAVGNNGRYSQTDSRASFSRDHFAGLLPEEKAKLDKRTAVKFVDLMEKLPDAKEMAVVAIAGQAKRGWYAQSAKAISHVFGADAPRFTALLASMSPQTSVEKNLSNALRTWKGWIEAGRPQDRATIHKIMGENVEGNNLTDSVLPAWVNNSVRSLTHDNPAELTLSGPKVNSFLKNLIGHAHEVTNDAWMANYAAVDQTLFKGELNKSGTDPGKRPGYLAMSARTREAAAYLTKKTGETWTPAEVQETVWSWARTLYNMAGGGKTAKDILQNKEMTDALINSTPDFRSLLNEQGNAKTLRAAGYGDKLDELKAGRGNNGASKVGGAQGKASPFAEDIASRHLNRAAGRLDALRDSRGIGETEGEVYFSREEGEKMLVGALARNAQQWSHIAQQIQHLYQQGRTIAQIASAVRTAPGTVRRMLGSIFQPVPGHLTLPEETRMKKLERLFVDRFNRIKVVQDAVVGQGGTLNDMNDMYLAFERLTGKAEYRHNLFVDNELKPMIEGAAKAGVTLNQLGEYVYAKHAPERNAQIAKINPKMQDGGSGISNAEAARRMADLMAQPHGAEIKAFGEQLLAIARGSRDVLEHDGLLSAGERAAWEGAYQDYVPLRGGKDEGELDHSGTGRFIDQRGKLSQRAKGRYSEADVTKIIGDVINDRFNAIVRAEKNRVGKTLLKFILDNPDSALWQLDENKITRSITKDANGNEKVVETRSANRNPDNTIVTKVQGREFIVTIKDEQLAKTLMNADAAELHTILQHFGGINRWLTKFWTQYNPVFVATNFVRDFSTGMIHTVTDHGIARAASVAGYIPSAITNMLRYQRGARVGGHMLDYVREFHENGGKTAYIDAKDIDERIKQITAMHKSASGGSLEGAKSLAKGVLDWISDMNTAVENGIRVASYRAAREAGQSEVQSATVAKNLTVNFNRRGEWGPQLNALFLFFNPNVQGTARIIQAAKRNPKAFAGIAAGFVGMGFAAAMLSSQDEDEDGVAFWDKPDVVNLKSRSLVLIMPGSGGKRLVIPLPYGYNALVSLGYAMHDLARNKMARGAVAGQMLDGFMSGFSPVGGNNVLAGGALALLPTAVQPFAQLAANKNSFGQPIHPDQGNEDKPDSEKMFGATRGTATSAVSSFLNTVTGGDQNIPGSISMSPETLSFWGHFVAGGLGSAVMDGTNVLTQAGTMGPGQADWGKFPFVKQFYGEHKPEQDAALYYERGNQLKEVLGSYETAVAQEDQGKVDALRAKYGDQLIDVVGGMLSDFQGQLKDIRDSENKVRLSDDSFGSKELQLKELEAQKGKVYQEFNRAFTDANGGKVAAPVPTRLL